MNNIIHDDNLFRQRSSNEPGKADQDFLSISEKSCVEMHMLIRCWRTFGRTCTLGRVFKEGQSNQILLFSANQSNQIRRSCLYRLVPTSLHVSFQRWSFIGHLTSRAKLCIITSRNRRNRAWIAVFTVMTKYIPPYPIRNSPLFSNTEYYLNGYLEIHVPDSRHRYNFLKKSAVSRISPNFQRWTLALNIPWMWDLLPNISACLGIIRLIRWPETVHLVDRVIRSKLTDTKLSTFRHAGET